jgi:hypothetical protein
MVASIAVLYRSNARTTLQRLDAATSPTFAVALAVLAVFSVEEFMAIGTTSQRCSRATCGIAVTMRYLLGIGFLRL